jgi:hypothetical protein
MGVPTLVLAQTAKPTGQSLAGQLEVGRLIEVTSADGKTIKGQVARVSGNSFVVSGLSKKQPLGEWQFSLDAPSTYSVRRDPIWNGMAIWAGVIGGATALGVYSGGYGDCENANPQNFCSGITITMTLVGAGLGAALDFARDRSELRVDFRPPTGQRAFQVSPVVGRRRLGVALGMRF